MLSIKDEFKFQLDPWWLRMRLSLPASAVAAWSRQKRPLGWGVTHQGQELMARLMPDPNAARRAVTLGLIEGQAAPRFERLCASGHIIIVGRVGALGNRYRWIPWHRLEVTDDDDGTGRDRVNGQPIFDLHVAAGLDWLLDRPGRPVPAGYPAVARDWWSFAASAGELIQALVDAYNRRIAIRNRTIEADTTTRVVPRAGPGVVGGARGLSVPLKDVHAFLSRPIRAADAVDLSDFEEQDKAWSAVKSAIRDGVRSGTLVALGRSDTSAAAPLRLVSFNEEWLQSEDDLVAHPDGREFYDVRFCSRAEFDQWQVGPISVVSTARIIGVETLAARTAAGTTPTRATRPMVERRKARILATASEIYQKNPKRWHKIGWEGRRAEIMRRHGLDPDTKVTGYNVETLRQLLHKIGTGARS